MLDHVTYISCFSLILMFVVVKCQFLMEIIEKTTQYLSDFMENQSLQPVKLRFLIEMLTG